MCDFVVQVIFFNPVFERVTRLQRQKKVFSRQHGERGQGEIQNLLVQWISYFSISHRARMRLYFYGIFYYDETRRVDLTIVVITDLTVWCLLKY